MKENSKDINQGQHLHIRQARRKKIRGRGKKNPQALFGTFTIYSEVCFISFEDSSLVLFYK
jgi:hypothetical protein